MIYEKIIKFEGEKEGEKNITGDTRQRVSFEPVVKKNLRSKTVFRFFSVGFKKVQQVCTSGSLQLFVPPLLCTSSIIEYLFRC